MTCNSGLRMMVLVVVAAGFVAQAEALAVPPRRLARRGVIVVPPPGTEAVVVPAPGSAPVVVAPAPRPRRRMLLQPAQPGPAGVPGAPSVAGRQPAAAIPAAPSRGPTPATPAPTAAASSAATAKPGATAAATTKPAAAAPEQIPTPRPTPAQSSAGQPTVATATAATAATAETIAFTPDWYAKHPQAWRPAKSPNDWWKTADVATITAWLGQPISAAGTAADGAGAVATAGGGDVGADGLRSVLVLPAGHQNAVGPADSDWLPLGVFAMVPPGTQDTAQSHNYQQLAIDRQGAIRGNFYDTLSGTIQPITGTVDRAAVNASGKATGNASCQASWTVGTNGSRFTAPMDVFAGQSRAVSVSSGGQPRDMELIPVQRPSLWHEQDAMK